ncbi:MAG: DUF7664 domain-containing protein [Streptosporangiaceae bacterium]
MTSKYDSYWAGRLGEIRAGVERAAAGLPAVAGLPGLRGAGERASWYGFAEVRGRGLTRSSMAHATSLGRAVAASSMCAAWPQCVFRFTIAAPGDTLTITAAQSRSGQQDGAAVTPQGPARGAGEPGLLALVPRDAPPADRGGLDETAVSRFYLALGQLAQVVPGPRRLRDCRGSDGWPQHGVYFFFEPGEIRADGSDRVVRVGTHALTATSQATLWGRLRQHRGHVAGLHPGGGNHRASVLRWHVGAALIRRDQLPSELLGSWLDRHGPRAGCAAPEARIEQAVSACIGAMPFLWLRVPDRADRGFIERNSIAVTSRLAEGPDQPSTGWLGRHAARTEISQSGLWNIDHIRHHREPGFPDLLDRLVQQQ